MASTKVPAPLSVDELLRLKDKGVKKVELNEAGTIKSVEFYPDDAAATFAHAADTIADQVKRELLASVEDPAERAKLEAKLNESLVYAGSSHD